MELAAARRAADRASTVATEAKQQAAAIEEERAMVANDLTGTRKQLDSTVRDLDAAERRAQAIHREKLETVARLREELVTERAAVEKAPCPILAWRTPHPHPQRPLSLENQHR